MTMPPTIPVSRVLDHTEGREILASYLPGILDSPQRAVVRDLPLGDFLDRPETGLAQERKTELLAALRKIEGLLPLPSAAGYEVFEADPGYEEPAVVVGSARALHPDRATRWSVFEVELHGPRHGNPFTEVELTARFVHEDHSVGDAVVEVGGFYDGEGVYRIRFQPAREGSWTFHTSSTARSLDAISGSFVCGPALPGAHGPVGVADRYHFAHADGTRYAPFGTTAYAWTHQEERLQEQTLRTLEGSPFTKLRMCVFPKSFQHNANEPELFPFEGTPHGWDTTRFAPAFFRHLECRIRDLDALGVQADLILFHPYDRWGFSTLGGAADDRYVRYLVRRLAAFPNVWWSLANEYDLVHGKTTEDWERIATVVQENDHVGHLRSIHNFQAFYPHTRPWITHCSLQRVDLYRTAEETAAWRWEWGKPVIVDECGYEGDLEQSWGNLTGEELVRRAWEGTLRGGYVGHGETYANERDELWWSKGGRLTGSSPKRLAFLAELVAASPTGMLEPADLGRVSGDFTWGGSPGDAGGSYFLGYLGLGQSRTCTIDLPEGEYTVDVIDTWDMTVERRPGTFRATARIELPGRPRTAIRLIRTAVYGDTTGATP